MAAVSRCLCSLTLLFSFAVGARIAKKRGIESESCPYGTAPDANGTIRSVCSPDSPSWKDTEGNRIEAHGAGILEHTDGKIYWYGESRKFDEAVPLAFNVYSSESGFDGPWKFIGEVLTLAYLQEELDKDADRNQHLRYDIGVMERPKVIYNEDTEMFVMWFHLDDQYYLQRHVGIATSPTPDGPFVFRNRLAENKGMAAPSLDMSLWKDPVTKKGFSIRDQRKWSRKNEAGFGVDFNFRTGLSVLSNDYLSIERDLLDLPIFEGMGIFYETPTWPKYEENPGPGGRYWMIGSKLQGWFPSDLIVWQTQWGSQGLDDPQNVWTQVAGPGSWRGSICSPNTGDGLRSQPAYISRTKDRNGNQYFVYHGDNWILGLDWGAEWPDILPRLQNSGYVWLPFRLDNGQLELKWRGAWSAETILAEEL